MQQNLIVAFLAGLTAGGLGCLVVQGGLLTGPLARQIEQERRPRLALPIGLFLLAKLAAYTLLGALLGAFGSVLQLAPLARALLMIAIGVFVFGNGLRLLGAHPLFRWFVFEPPAGVTRFARRASRGSRSAVAPLFLGALTVLLPCGVAQAMMATALGTGDPIQGASLLFAFTLGTFPVFFAAAYFASRLGAALELRVARVVAVVLLVIGAVSVVHGLNLAGAPVSLPRSLERLALAPAASASGAVGDQGADFVVTVDDVGYTPKVLHLPAGRPVTLVWTTRNVRSCARSVVVPGLGYEKILPVTGRVSLAIAAQQPGTVLKYSCGMGMRTGRLAFDLRETAARGSDGDSGGGRP